MKEQCGYSKSCKRAKLKKHQMCGLHAKQLRLSVQLAYMRKKKIEEDIQLFPFLKDWPDVPPPEILRRLRR